MHRDISRHISSAILLVLLCCLSLSALTQGATTNYYETPSEYFLTRELSNKRIPNVNRRNPNSQPYKQKSHTRYQSQGGWKTRMTKMTPVAKTEMFDATLRYDTYDLDLHPYVLDIGCIKNGLYIRPEGSQESIDALRVQLSAGNLLVSRKQNFICHDHSLNDKAESKEKVLYRLIVKSQFVYNKENGISYFELQTTKLSFLQLFSKLKILMSKPIGQTTKKVDFGSRYVGQKNEEKAFQTGWNVKKDSKGNTIYSNGSPKVDVAKYTQSISIFTLECQDCYFNMYAGYYMYAETDMPWDLVDTVRAYGIYDVRVIFPSLKVSTTDKISKEFDVLPKKDLYTFAFAVGPIPIELSVGIGVKFNVELDAKSSVIFKADYIRSGQSGFTYVEGKTQRTSKQITNSGGFSIKDYSVTEASIKFQVKPTLYITFYEMVPILVSIDPYILAKVSKSTKSGCKVGLDTYWGVEGTVGVDEIEFLGYTIWEGYTWSFDIMSQSSIPALSGLCLKKSRRAIDENFMIGSVDQITEIASLSETITDSSTLVTRKITLAALDEIYFDVIRLDMKFTVSCRISYGTVSFDLSSGAIDILIYDVKMQNVNEITIAISKETTETVQFNYLKVKSSLKFGQTGNVRAGIISFEEPTVVPDYIDIKTSSGSVAFTSSNDVIPSLIKTSSITFPLLLTYSGADATIAVYPVYASSSGDRLSHIVTSQSNKFAVKYSGNSGLSPFTFENLIVSFQTTSKEVFSVNFIGSTSPTFDATILHTMSGSQPMDVYSENALNFVPTYLYFEVTGSFSSYFELEFELLESYGYSVSSNFELDYVTQSAYALTLYRSSEFGDQGVVVEFDNRTRGFVSYDLPTEFKKLDSVYVSTASRRNLFGISRQYHEGLLENNIHLRVEPRSPKISVNILTGAVTVTFAGKFSVTALKNQNLTIDITFVNNGHDMNTIDYSLLREKHNVFMAINIKDPQYTFNSLSIADVNHFSKFILSIKCTETHDSNEHSDWNDLILPLIVSDAVSGAKGFIVLENPQRMLVKLPVFHNLEKRVEKVYFTTVSPNLFSPKPLAVFGVGEIDLVGNDLTPGDIGSVIASVLGFTIIGILIVVLIIVIVWFSFIKKKKPVAGNEANKPEASVPPPVQEVQEQPVVVVEMAETQPSQVVIESEPSALPEQPIEPTPSNETPVVVASEESV